MATRRGPARYPTDSPSICHPKAYSGVFVELLLEYDQVIKQVAFRIPVPKPINSLERKTFMMKSASLRSWVDTQTRKLAIVWQVNPKLSAPFSPKRLMQGCTE